MRTHLMIAVMASVMAPSLAQAQQQQQPQQPGIVVVSEQKCGLDKLTELNQWMRTSGAPVLDDLVRQGKLLGWGVLQHLWGDEWNNVIYYTARDITTFTAAFGEYFQRLQQREPNVMQKLAGWCSEHRDNIYSVVLTNSVQPPVR